MKLTIIVKIRETRTCSSSPRAASVFFMEIHIIQVGQKGLGTTNMLGKCEISVRKVTDFLSFCPFGISIFPFLTIRISMYQKRILPNFISPSTFSPQASSPLERSRTFITPCYRSNFFFPTERAGPYCMVPAGATLHTGLSELLQIPNQLHFFLPKSEIFYTADVKNLCERYKISR